MQRERGHRRNKAGADRVALSQVHDVVRVRNGARSRPRVEHLAARERVSAGEGRGMTRIYLFALEMRKAINEYKASGARRRA